MARSPIWGEDWCREDKYCAARIVIPERQLARQRGRNRGSLCGAAKLKKGQSPEHRMASFFFGGGAILLGVLITLTTALKWPRWLNYIWAALAFIWGIIAFV